MSDFGRRLREARERRGLTVRQIAETTKISAVAIEALERNDLSRLPGGIFSRGFVRSYAIEVGLDADATVRDFLDSFDAAEPPPAAAAVIPEAETDFENRQRIAAIVLALVVISVVLIGIILFLSWRVGRGSDARADAHASLWIQDIERRSSTSSGVARSRPTSGSLPPAGRWPPGPTSSSPS